ncbi:hypothetical protein Q4603_22100 [Zobellia galactanivorans]|uniref:hypothetical protein n=1 Tax=Zobellia galactanivorans (strain DSM 12802 / CCUG 47099 / CIP 106680 / NCIMB 13871 / Dsij) TaxID=63186 RepID=UPI0026E44407|nr:hypothetical protein [Zobellia galactanivorans]MDO6811323.1 hypothetical protein [Zobellia galactanivorans]
MKNEILKEINTIVGKQLLNGGFKPNKALSLYKYNDNKYRVDFIFDIKNRQDSCLQHIKFEFTNKALEKVFKEFDNKLRVKNEGEPLSFNRPSLEITDWKIILKKHNLVINDFWFHHFDSLNAMKQSEKKYIQFSDLVIKLKKELQNTELLKEYLLDNDNEYHLSQYLCLAYINTENLEEAYQKVKEISKDYLDHLKQDLKDFYELLEEAKATV